MLTPNTAIQAIADSYNRYIIGLPAPVRGHYVQVDHRLARLICEAYERLPLLERDQRTAYCYNQLATEIMQQFDILVEFGYDFEPWMHEGQPYANSDEMRLDVAQNKHLYFFQGGEPNVFLTAYAATLHGVECSINDIFRAVHDVFGHACEGYGFGQRGEENAWIHHSMMFTADAQAALTTETRGQNSWVNESDANAGLPACERAYAVQKAALLPSAFCKIPDSIAVQWQGHPII